MGPGTFKSIFGKLFGIDSVSGSLWWKNADADGADIVFNALSNKANFRNLLDGGDFTINPFQRGSAQAANITNTLTYGPDRWAFLGAAGSAIQWSQQSDQNIPKFNNSLRWQRANANADVNQLRMIQVMESADCYRAQGSPVTLSFYAYASPTWTGGQLTATIVYGTGTNQSAANALAGTWTGQTTLVTQSFALQSSTGLNAVTNPVTRYSITGVLPTNATQIAVIFTWIPSGTAGASDYIQMSGIQLELGTRASVFEQRDVQVELEICQRYCWVINEPAAGVVVGMGACNSTTAAIIYMATPVQLRAAPTVTVTAGTFHGAPAGATASGTIAAGATHTPNAITINISSMTATTAGFGTPLVGSGGSGLITASADL